MGWFYDIDHPAAAAHEGYPALVLDDGEVTSEHSSRTRGRVVGWRAACDCGWLHSTLMQMPDEIGDATMAPEEFEQAIYIEWRLHIRQDVPELYQAANDQHRDWRWQQAPPQHLDEHGIPRPWPGEG